MKRIALVTTGGTIGETKTSLPPGRRHVTGSALLGQTASRLPADVDVRVRDLFDVPSTELGLPEMREIVRVASELSREADGVVVSHGTVTIEETAYLADLVTDPEIPIVFTGAMRPFDHPESDGAGNLRDAIVVASSPTRRVGTTVVFAGVVYAAADVTKVHTTRVEAFASPEFGPLARVADGSLEWARLPASRPSPVPLGERHPRVEIVTCYGGMTAFAVEAAGALRVDGLVVEGFGGGEVPPELAPTLRRLSEQGIAVAVTTRVAVGALAPVSQPAPWYRSAQRAKKLRIRLWVGLAAGFAGEALRAYVEDRANQTGEVGG